MHDVKFEAHKECPTEDVVPNLEGLKSGHTSDEEHAHDFDVISDACACIGVYLNETMKHLECPPEERSTFDASCEPLIGIVPYFQRICRYSKLTPESACSALVLVKRICSNPENCLQLTNYNAHRLLLTSSMVFAKYYDDELDSNARWAKIAGLQLAELNLLEIDLLNCCNFDMRVSREEFDSNVRNLVKMRDCTPTMHPPVQNLPRTSSARSGQRSPPSHRSPTHRPSRSRHTLNGFSPPTSRASSPTHLDRKNEGTPESGTKSPTNKSPTNSVSSPKHRRTVSGAFVNFFHNHPKLHHGHHGQHGHHANGVRGSDAVAMGSVPEGQEECAASTPVSPSSSPHHGFHLRIPRTTSLQSLSHLLHVSPRFHKQKHSKKEGGVREAGGVRGVRRSSTKDDGGMLAFTAHPNGESPTTSSLPPLAPPHSRAPSPTQEELQPECLGNRSPSGYCKPTDRSPSLGSNQDHGIVSNVLAH